MHLDEGGITDNSSGLFKIVKTKNLTHYKIVCIISYADYELSYKRNWEIARHSKGSLGNAIKLSESCL